MLPHALKMECGLTLGALFCLTAVAWRPNSRTNAHLLKLGLQDSSIDFLPEKVSVKSVNIRELSELICSQDFDLPFDVD